MSKTYETKATDKPDSKPGTAFTLNIEAGDFRVGEVIALMGENGCGKTTFMEVRGRTSVSNVPLLLTPRPLSRRSSWLET